MENTKLKTDRQTVLRNKLMCACTQRHTELLPGLGCVCNASVERFSYMCRTLGFIPNNFPKENKRSH